MPKVLDKVKEITQNLGQFKGQLEFVRTFFAAAADPVNTEKVFEFSHVMTSKASPEQRREVSELLNQHPDSRQMLKERYLAPHYTTEDLAHYQPGTLGYAYYRHLHDNGFDPNFAPPVEVKDDLTYFAARQSQLHDIWHVLAGFSPNMAHETGLQAFTVAQMPAQAFTASLVSAGILYTVLKDRSLVNPTMEAVSTGWCNGKAARPMLSTKWEELWDHSLEELRREYNITPYSALYNFEPQLAEVGA